MKTLWATKKLQQTELYKELKANIQSYYRFSLSKEQRQKKYLNSKGFVNQTNGEMFTIDYDFEKEHTKYYKLIEQKISTVEQIAKNLGFVSVFITFTLPSQYHPFTSIQKGHQRLYVDINKNFAFHSIDNAIRDGYNYLNHIVRTFYKRIKNHVDNAFLFVKVFEAHATMIPHCHYLIFFPIDYIKTVKSTFENVVVEFGLTQTDFEHAVFRDGINYSTRYIMKYLTKDIKNGADYFLIRSLDGWKRKHKIRVITASQLDLSMYLYKKIYYSLPTDIKKYIDKYIKEVKIPYYLYLQNNTYIKKTLIKKEKKKTTTETSTIGEVGAAFMITIKSNRIRAPNGKPSYKITFLEIEHLGAVIYRNNTYLIL